MNKAGYIYQGNIDTFHEWLTKHPKLSTISLQVWNTVFSALRTAEGIHKDDSRQNGLPYILHPIEVVKSMIKNYPEKIYINDCIVLILHDAIEDHPESWREIFDTFDYQIFRDILILSKIPMSIRREILKYIVQYHDVHDALIGEILQMLDPNDPLIKFNRFSSYSEDLLGQDAQRFQAAILIYKQEIIDVEENQDVSRDEYLSLGNYLYFRRKDAKRKLQDMLHNMSDMKTMEIKKPGYIEKRRIKAYILGVKLRNFGMKNEYAQLQEAFQKANLFMYTDDEIFKKIQGS